MVISVWWLGFISTVGGRAKQQKRNQVDRSVADLLNKEGEWEEKKKK